MAKKKYYVVWQGNKPGVYDTWGACQLQIKGFPNAKFKSFPSLEAAVKAYNGSAADFVGTGKKSTTTKTKGSISRSNIVWKSLAVDAACSGNPGAMEYRGVDTKTGVEIFKQGPFRYGTNNVGEFLALVHGLAYLKRLNSSLPIYSDSKIAIGWVTKKKFNSKLERRESNKELFELVDRAIIWLKKNTYTTQILKWETKSWGEIPADFGRK